MRLPEEGRVGLGSSGERQETERIWGPTGREVWWVAAGSSLQLAGCGSRLGREGVSGGRCEWGSCLQ